MKVRDIQANELPQTMAAPLRQMHREMISQLNAIILEDGDMLKKAKSSVETVSKILGQLRVYILENSFGNSSEEIIFFKEIKPRFYSEYIYYYKIYQIELLRPTGSPEDEMNYLAKNLKSLNDFFQANLPFYQYFRAGESYMDEAYFLRGNGEKGFLLDYFSLDADTRFSTNHDYKVSMILANEQLKIYLNASIEELKRTDSSEAVTTSINTELPWTAPKAALTELIYALHSFGAFKYGQAEIKDIANYFEKAFNINLGNLYRAFQEIRIRKKSRSYFLDQLKDHLIKRMDDTDENPRR